MPTARRPCLHPRCRALVGPGDHGRCSEHRRAHERERGTRSERGYDAAWSAARRAYLLEHPLCVKCLEQDGYEQATDVDHIVPWRTGATEAERERLFWDESNWQALCHAHHSQKTRREQMGESP